jgi:hypothetical protein
VCVYVCVCVWAAASPSVRRFTVNCAEVVLWRRVLVRLCCCLSSHTNSFTQGCTPQQKYCQPAFVVVTPTQHNPTPSCILTAALSKHHTLKNKLTHKTRSLLDACTQAALCLSHCTLFSHSCFSCILLPPAHSCPLLAPAPALLPAVWQLHRLSPNKQQTAPTHQPHHLM